MSDDIMVLVHVPKTAGTSFRMALEGQLGPAAMVYDYGPDSPVTSELVRHLYYGRNDPDRLRDALVASPARVLCGHFPATRYLPLFGAASTMLFLRDPIQRLVSEFQHYVRHNGYTRGFDDFFRTPAFINRQQAFAAGAALEDYAFVGITEQYERSLALANARFGWRLPNLALNMARPSLAADYVMEGEGVQELQDLNAADVRFYEEAVALFDARAAGLS